MGSGPRFQCWLIKGLMLGLTVDRFPFDWTFTVVIGPVGLSYGFGRAYDDSEGASHE